MRARLTSITAMALCLAQPAARAFADGAPAGDSASAPSSAPAGDSASAPASPAAEQPRPRWDQGERGRLRRAHLILTLSLGALYGASETIFKDALSPEDCRWCAPPGFDASARDALVWNDAQKARTLSDVAAYGAVPLLTLSLSILPALHQGTSGAEILDAAVPIVESVIISQSLAQVAKLGVGRQRPYARFDGLPAVANDDNLSFFSAHASFVFSLVTSSATMARMRGSRAEPVIWAVGLPLATATGYLRIAGDKHYLSDVLVGGAVGAVTGLLVPRWYRYDLTVMPTGNGAAVAGRF